MTKSWEVDCDGVRHKVEYKTGFGLKMIIDGQTTKLRSNNMLVSMIDHAFSFGDTKCNLTAIGNKADLAVNGVYLDSGEPYVPHSKVPIWVYILLAINVVGPFIIGGGILGALIGVLFGSAYIRYALRNKTGIVIGLFIGCIVLQLLLIVALASIIFNLPM